MKKVKKYSVLVFTVLLMVGLVPSHQTEAETDESDNPKTIDDLIIEDGMTQEVFSYEEAMMETVYVETSFDNDGDGENERISVKVIRPLETEEGLQVPVIYNMSSYNGGLDYPDYHNVDEELYKGIPYNLPDYYEDYFVPRGYAVVIADGLGAGGSTGCPTVGDEHEIAAAKSVVDWLNGRTTAFNEDGDEVTADWTTGKVGMVGKSYDGTIANGLAATGVEGLETIVPIGAISNWYDYYRANGAVIAPGGYQGDDLDLLAKGVLTRENPEVCADLMDQLEEDQDRVTGDYSEFWEARNYLNDTNNIHASVFLVHGLNDINVKRKQYAQWWDKLKQYEVPRKLWLHQGAHTDPIDERGEEWLSTLNRWFDYWLYDIDNGIMDEPKVEVENVDGSWEPLQEWPRVDAVEQTLYLSNSSEGPVGLSLNEKPADNGKESFTDDASKTAEELIKEPLSHSPNRLAYLSPTLTEDIRLSGTPSLSISASVDRPAANLSAWLVDYGPDGVEVVTRGWMDAQNVNSISESEVLVPDKKYTFSWDMEPHDYKFSEGHQIGLVIVSSDHEYTKRPEPGTTITLYPEESIITLPLAGEFPTESSATDEVSWYVDEGLPTRDLGKTDDLYLDILTKDIYIKLNDGWKKIGNLSDDKEIPGVTWFVGDQAPTKEEGKQGDLFLDSTNGEVYLKGDSGWELLAKLSDHDNEKNEENKENNIPRKDDTNHKDEHSSKQSKQDSDGENNLTNEGVAEEQGVEEEDKDGDVLPKTATNTPLLILIGVCITIAGIVLFFIQRRLKTRMQE